MGANTNPAPEVDQKPGTHPPAAALEQATASQRILEDNSNRGTDNDSRGDNKNSTSTRTPENSATKVSDGSDDHAPGHDTANQLFLEVENYMKTAESVRAVAKMLSTGITAETAAKFGNLLIGHGDGSGGDRATALTQEAKAEDTKKTTDKSTDKHDAPGELSATGDALNSIGSWAADSFKQNVTRPVSEAMSDLTNAFDDAVQWFGQPNTFTPTTAEIKVEKAKYAAAEQHADGDINLDGAHDRSGEGLKLPKNAVDTGSVEIGGNKVSVMRTPEGDTYLKDGDKVIGHRKADGSYELALKDGSSLDLKLSEGEGGKYKLDHLERMKDGKLQQKVADGVMYNYNYDKDGKITSVDAASDLKGPLTPEKLESIKKELGTSGVAALRVTEDGKTERLLLQVHDQDTSSLTNIDQQKARLFLKNQEYGFNEQNQLGLINGKQWTAPEPAQDPTQADQQKQQQQRLEDLARRLGKRANGDSNEAIDGIAMHEDPSTKVTTVKRVDSATGETQTTTEIPAAITDAITVTNLSGEKTEIKGDNIDVKIAGDDGKQTPLFDFNTKTGLKTDNMLVDGDGLTDLDTGARIDNDGNVRDSEDNMIGGSFDKVFGSDPGEWQEIKQDQAVAKAVSADVSTLCNISLSVMQGNPQVAINLAAEAFGKANSALSAVGNDLAAQIPIYNSLAMAQTAFARADRSNQTEQFAMSSGISDATQLAHFGRVATMSSTTFSPSEFVRDQSRLRVVA